PAADARAIEGRGPGRPAGPERCTRRLAFVETLVWSIRTVARAHETREAPDRGAIPGGRAPIAHRDLRGPWESSQCGRCRGRRGGARDGDLVLRCGRWRTPRPPFPCPADRPARVRRDSPIRGRGRSDSTTSA